MLTFGFVLTSIVLFLIGLAVGSFVNVVVTRSLKGESWVSGRSRCDHCRVQIAWFDNIPLLSFVVLRAKCRACKRPIAVSHPAIELLVGSLFVWWYWVGFLFFKLTELPFSILQPLFWLVVGVIMVMLLISDLSYYLLPDTLVGGLLLITIIYRVGLVMSGVMQANDLMLAVMGLALNVGFFASLWWVTRGRGLGFGDVKLAAPLALLLGWPQVVLGTMLSFILGGFIAAGLLISGKKRFGQVVPFGPFMIAGTVVSLLWGESLIGWYLGLLS